MKKKIKTERIILDPYDIFDEKTLDEAIEKLVNIYHDNIDANDKLFSVETKNIDGWDAGVEIAICGFREETDHEAKERLKEEAVYAEAQKIRELSLLNKLKKKYENSSSQTNKEDILL